MTSPTTLLDFPEDIFSNIFHSLSQPDLHALCLTCKTLCYLPEPILYSHIKWVWLTSQTPPITLLLRSILSRPQLATYIQNLVLEGKFFDWINCGRAPKISVAKGDLERPLSLVKSLKVPYRDLWIRELEVGTMDAFVAVLISQLSHLRNLSIGPNFAQQNLILGMVLKSALCEGADMSHGLSAFKHLQNVSFRYIHAYPRGEKLDNGRYRLHKNTDEVLPIFYLPALQHLSITIDNPVSFAWPAQKSPTLSTLVSLDVAYLRENHLRQIFSLTTGLKTLKWSWFYEEMAAFDDDHRSITKIIDLDKIAEALLPVRETLMDLTITADLYILDGEDPPAMNGSLEAIVNFNKLKRFEVPQVMMNGRFTPPMVKPFAQILPKNIESIIITEKLKGWAEPELGDTDLVEPLRAWLSSWKMPTPNLQSISVLVWASDYEWGPEIRKELKEICDGAGISLDITTLTFDQWNFR